MQSLRDYLNHTRQCESILDPNQDQVMSRMADATDDMIRKRIREYCTWDRQKYYQGELWPAVDDDLGITQIDKDNNGWYIETRSAVNVGVIYGTRTKSFYDYCLSKGQKIDKQKGFLIEDIGVYFRWRKHKGSIEITDASCLESTLGLPEELDLLYLDHCCKENKKFAVHSRIDVIIVCQIDTINISGNGCQNVVQHYLDGPMNIMAPEGVKIHRPSNWDEYLSLFPKSTY